MNSPHSTSPKKINSRIICLWGTHKALPLLRNQRKRTYETGQEPLLQWVPLQKVKQGFTSFRCTMNQLTFKVLLWCWSSLQRDSRLLLAKIDLLCSLCKWTFSFMIWDWLFFRIFICFLLFSISSSYSNKQFTFRKYSKNLWVTGEITRITVIESCLIHSDSVVKGKNANN